MTEELQWMAMDCFIKTGRDKEENESCCMIRKTRICRGKQLRF